MFMGEKFGRDSIWESHLGKEVRSTDLKLDAMLGQKRVRMSDVVNLKVGSTIVLEQQPDDDITLMCGGIPMMTGKLGKMGEYKAVKVKPDYVYNTTPTSVDHNNHQLKAKPKCSTLSIYIQKSSDHLYNYIYIYIYTHTHTHTKISVLPDSFLVRCIYLVHISLT